MFSTTVTKMLGIKYPIVGGTMMSISNADFTAAISNAGGLGILNSAMYNTREEFAAAVDRVQELTREPFAVNINLFPAMRKFDNKVYVEVMAEKGVKIVETSGHSAPADLAGPFKEAKMTWIHKCVGVQYARKARELGADIVTVVGYENGGATGKLDLGAMVMVPAVVRAVDVPVIGGGGVSDGHGLVAMLALGAQAAIMGTRLLTTQECPVHPKLKEALVNATELDTMLIMRSIGANHRVWNNAAAKKCAQIEAAKGSFNEVISIVAGDKARRMYQDGDLDAGVISCGQGVGLCRDVPTVADLFQRIMKEAREIVSGLAAS
ncbi:MAG TPA: nitronate monooxygenase family protein [bacterium]|nr:nitronate monooxygenase family protein [bacterium]